MADADLRSTIAAMNPAQSLTDESNQVDELRYLFLVSQVELVESAEAVQGAKYYAEAEGIAIAVVDAEGKKCDRCWNYSTHVGESSEHPTICERCVAALADDF